jgi:hypothetical protein
MQGICGVFSSSLAADWFGAGGSVAAAFLAVVLYSHGRRDAKRDRTDQRAVLQAMIEPHLKSASGSLIIMYDQRELIGLTLECTRQQWPNISSYYKVDAFLRLSELQMQLVHIGQRQDARIVAFIEQLSELEAVRGRVDSQAVEPVRGVDIMWRVELSRYIEVMGTCVEQARPIARRLGIPAGE